VILQKFLKEVELHPTRPRQEHCFTKMPFIPNIMVNKSLRKITQSRAPAENFQEGRGQRKKRTEK